MAENKHAKIESKGVDIVAKYGKGFWVREVVSQSPREMGLPQNMLHSFSSATEIIALKDYSTGGQGLLISFCLNFSKIIRIQTGEKDYCFSYFTIYIQISSELPVHHHFSSVYNWGWI